MLPKELCGGRKSLFDTVLVRLVRFERQIEE
jgi:hypothetical protein